MLLLTLKLSHSGADSIRLSLKMQVPFTVAYVSMVAIVDTGA